ncbi:MAG: alpha/beta hydrolase [Actinomycetota bacterium]|nr:alpha/beta hydrolase [Actinomycetota bacterium]
MGDGRVVGRLAVTAGAPVLLLLHGHPQTHLIWHHLARPLAERYTVVALDLPGYGASRPSTSGPDAQTKRAMAADLDDAMRVLGELHGFDRYAVLAHDRGARVTHRLLLDRPQRVTRAMFLDIAPTLDMYDGTTRGYATAYWHWFFLIQPAPLPERLIGADPDAYVDATMGTGARGLETFAPEALAAYRAALRDPDVVHAMCEDYRASAGPDLELDRADRAAGRLVCAPLRVLWGSQGVVERFFDPLALWSAVATEVTGQSLECGHYVPEEVPDALLADALEFFG